MIYKRFAVTRWTDPWAALLRPPPALRSYVMGHGLRCAACRRPGRWPYGTARGSASSVKDTCSPKRPPTPWNCPVTSPACVASRRGTPGLLHGLIDQTARLLAALHDRRLSHRDLKGANLLVNAVPWFVSSRGAVERQGPVTGTLTAPQIWFIDLVGVRRHDRLTEERGGCRTWRACTPVSTAAAS